MPLVSKFSRSRSRTYAVISALAVGSLVLTACTSDDDGLPKGGLNSVSDTVSQGVDETIEQAMEVSKSSEAIVGVWMPDDTAYVTTYGNEDLTANAPIRAGEASAPEGCAVLLELVQRGILELDREIVEDLPRQVGIEGITYADLCQGTSGLAEYKNVYEPMANANPERPWNPNELFAQGLTKSPLPGKGEDVYISNTDAVVLARALRAATGKSLNYLLNTYVFEPAKMSRTDYPDMSKTEAPDGAMNAFTYPRSGGDPVCDADPIQLENVSPTLLGGAGATITTADDLHKFYASYFAGEFGGKKLFNSVSEPQSLVNPKRDKDDKIVEEAPEPKEGQVVNEYAFGTEKIGPLYGRVGSLPGTMTASYIEPETGFTVVVSLNNSAGKDAIAKSAAFAIAAKAAEEAGFEIPWDAEAQSKQLDSLAICKD